MRGYQYLLAALTIYIAVWAVLLGYAKSHKDNSCDAPCTVHFSKPIAEDSFKIDYRGDGTLLVTKK